MGKEAKIGLTVIGALAVTLVVVLVMRLMRPSDPTVAGPAENKDTQNSPESPPSPATLATPAAPMPAAIQTPLYRPYGVDRLSEESDSRTAGDVTTSDSSPPLRSPSDAMGAGPYQQPPALSQIDSATDPYQTARLAKPSSMGADDLSSPPAAPSPSASYHPPEPPGSSAAYGTASSSGNSMSPMGPGGSGGASNPYDRRDGQWQEGSSSLASSGGNRYQPAPVSPVGQSFGDPSSNATNSGMTNGGMTNSGMTNAQANPYAGSSSGTSLSSDVAGGGRRSDGTYVVGPNENYWTISQRLYGNGAYFKALAEHNRAAHFDQDRLKPGDAIVAPDQSELQQRYPALCPSPERRDVAQRRASITNTSGGAYSRRSYTVQEGDTLYDIARFELGKGSRWAEIYNLNRELLQNDFDYLTPGMKLALPDDSRDTMTRRPGQTSPF